MKELKNRLSSYLREVRDGEIVLVTDRGRVVAELRQPTTSIPPTGLDRALERLSTDGVVVAGLPQDARAYRPSPLKLAVESRDLLDEERGER